MVPLIHMMQEFETENGLPPHTTSFTPDRREMLWPSLPSGRSGGEQVSAEGGGKTSTEGMGLPFQPPTINCPDAKVFKNHVTKKQESFNKQR